jgi:tetratricopeptide (TPR) repeat protein
MLSARSFFTILVALFSISISAFGQGMAEVCGDSGVDTFSSQPAVYGRVDLSGYEGRKLPKITITLIDRNRRDHRYTLDRTGNYCFNGVDGGEGTLVIDVEGTEAVRRSLGSSVTRLRQHRQDFALAAAVESSKASTISAKLAYERTAANAQLYEKAFAAEQNKDKETAKRLYKELVANDTKDFLAWARLGTLQLEENDIAGAERSYAESIRSKPDFAYSVMNLGRVLLAKKDIDLAIRFLQRATELEPTSARPFQLLGEAYILSKQGTLGVEALNEAIRLDPIGMADSHLLMAALYDRAGAKSWASREYKLFLEKKPDHTDKKRLEKYIKDNPPEPN